MGLTYDNVFIDRENVVCVPNLGTLGQKSVNVTCKNQPTSCLLSYFEVNGQFWVHCLGVESENDELV